MKNENLLTVSEYADAVGISKQAVYKKLNKSLKQFVVELNGKKYIDKAVFGDNENQKLKEVEQPLNQQLNNEIQPLLVKQIEEKDNTIQSLLRQVESLQEQNGKLAELLHQNQQLLSQSQTLLAVEKKVLLAGDTDTSENKQKKGFFGIFRKK